MLIFPNRLFQYFNWLFFFCTFFITFSSLSTTIVKHKRRIIQQLTPLSKKASINGQRLFEKIAKNELQEHIDDLYMQLFHWAKNEGINFVVCIIFNYFKITQKRKIIQCLIIKEL